MEGRSKRIYKQIKMEKSSMIFFKEKNHIQIFNVEVLGYNKEDDLNARKNKIVICNINTTAIVLFFKMLIA